MKRVLLATLSLLVPSPASAQVIEQGSSLLTTANAIMPGCTDTDGSAGATEATASCSAMGYAGSSSAQTTLVSSDSGGDISAFGEASATSNGPPQSQSSSANATSQGVITWQVVSDAYYSLSLATSGGANAQFDGGGGAPSGVLTPGLYTLLAQGSAFALAPDAGGPTTVHVGPRSASARIRFADVGSATLILGTVTAGGAGVPGLLVEALVGGSVVASTLTGDDGSYLLPDLPGPVAIRASDPAGEFATQVSSPQTPPASFDTDLAPAVPALPGALAGALALALLAAGALLLWARARRAGGTDQIA